MTNCRNFVDCGGQLFSLWRNIGAEFDNRTVWLGEGSATVVEQTLPS